MNTMFLNFMSQDLEVSINGSAIALLECVGDSLTVRLTDGSEREYDHVIPPTWDDHPRLTYPQMVLEQDILENDK